MADAGTVSIANHLRPMPAPTCPPSEPGPGGPADVSAGLGGRSPVASGMDPVVKSALIAAVATLVQVAALAQQVGLADAAAVPSPTSCLRRFVVGECYFS